MEYFDPLPVQSAGCTDDANKLSQFLGYRAAPDSPSGGQSDCWSCGLWNLRHMETRLVNFLGEPPTPALSLESTLLRLNDFCQRLNPSLKKKSAGSLPAVTSGPAASLEDALAAAVLCTKCKPTKLGYKVRDPKQSLASGAARACMHQ